jgi:heptosyltransferase-2
MRIALFLPNWVGDAVMATPAIRAIRRRFASAHLIGIGKPYVAAVMEGSPNVDKWISFDNRGPNSQRLLSVARQLRNNRVELGVIFPNSFRTALLAWLGGCSRRIGFARYGRSVLLTDCLKPIRDFRGRLVPSPILLDYNRLALQAGAPVDSLQMELFTSRADESQADLVWREAKFTNGSEVIALNPGGAFGTSKLWPADHFADLARRFVDERGSQILVLCGPAERDLARQIVRIVNRPRVVSLADQPVSLGLTKACIRRCDLLISTDSGVRHFAAAFNKPVVALFGPTFINWTNTYFPLEIRLQQRVPCGPCQRRECHLDHRCMKDLAPSEAFRAAVHLLNRMNFQSHPEVTRAA